MRASRTALLFAFVLALLGASSARAGIMFHAVLDGYQVVPAIGGPAYGECVGLVNEPAEALSLACVHNVFDATSATLWRGNPGQNGEYLYTFTNAEDPDCYWPLTDEDLTDLVLERLYVVITSPSRPAGALRGQIRLLQGSDHQLLFFDLGGNEVVPPVATPGLGQCGMSLAPDEPLGWLFSCRHTVVNATSVAVRIGTPGSNGPVVLEVDDTTSPVSGALPNDHPFFDDFVTDLLAGNVYLEVRSLAHPAGEVRGQIAGCMSGPEALCLLGRRYQVEMSFRPLGGQTAQAKAWPLTVDSGTFFYFRPDNREVLLKVLDACSLNDHHWVFFAATTNVEFTLTVTDTETGAMRQYSNALGHPATPVLDTAALPCP
jgi:hypothetical protein